MEYQNKFCRGNLKLKLEDFRILKTDLINSKKKEMITSSHSYIEGYLPQRECYSDSCPLSWNGWAYLAGEIVTQQSGKKKPKILFKKYLINEEDIYSYENMQKWKKEINLEEITQELQKEFDIYIKGDILLKYWHQYYQSNHPGWYNRAHSPYKEIELQPKKYSWLLDFFEMHRHDEELIKEFNYSVKKPLIFELRMHDLFDERRLTKEGLLVPDKKYWNSFLKSDWSSFIFRNLARNKLINETQNGWNQGFLSEKQELKDFFEKLR